MEQKNDYEFWVNKKTEFNPYKNERDYLIKNLIFQLYFLNQKKAFLICEKKGHKELFKEAIAGMLPKNKLRAKMMNNLKITE